MPLLPEGADNDFGQIGKSGSTVRCDACESFANVTAGSDSTLSSLSTIARASRPTSASWQSSSTSRQTSHGIRPHLDGQGRSQSMGGQRGPRRRKEVRRGSGRTRRKGRRVVIVQRTSLGRISRGAVRNERAKRSTTYTLCERTSHGYKALLPSDINCGQPEALEVGQKKQG